MQAPPGSCRLVARDLACRRGERLLFHGLSLTLGPGDGLHLTGPNGVGKSSLIRILAGLLPPFAGTVGRVGIAALADERLALDPQQPLGVALGFWAAFDALAGKEHQRAVAALGLGTLLDVPVRYLSTGQRKRAVLARTIAAGAPVWLLDEPLNGLDRHAGTTVEALVAEHCALGGIAVIASHQPFALAGQGTLALTDFVPADEPA